MLAGSNIAATTHRELPGSISAGFDDRPNVVEQGWFSEDEQGHYYGPILPGRIVDPARKEAPAGMRIS